MAIAEIATNQKVEGGGEYYIISRSFGLVIGSSIGIALYLSQAISVAFYIIAFAEAFSSLFDFLIQHYNLPAWLIWLMEKKQSVSIPALFLLTGIVLWKGAELGVKALYVVVVTLGISMLAFFFGQTEYSQNNEFDLFENVGTVELPKQERKPSTVDSLYTLGDSIVKNPNPVELTNAAQPPRQSNPARPLMTVGFFTIFAIIFPAFTGMTAGVGLSGDLKDPGKSIPLGTMAATISGMIIYVFIAYKLTTSASPVDLADTSKLVMADIAWQGWLIIPIGLAAATISSALGSLMVAPRTLQAIARDRVIPNDILNGWLSKGRGANEEPYNASVITIGIALAFILMGALDMVAEIISMFFMVTYGSLCLISFLQHFAADPSYRPRFKSRWYISLFGAIACFGLMFFMNAVYAVVAIALMIGLYFLINYYNQDKRSVAVIFQGVIFQFSRRLQVFLQKAEKEQNRSWRPSAIALSTNTFKRLNAFDLLRWISQRYGFGTYIHLISGYLSKKSSEQAKECKDRLIKMAEATESNIYIDTMVSPSLTSSIAQVIQLPGIAGTENNLLIFEYSKNNLEELVNIIDNFKLIKSVDFDVIVLGSCERGFGLKKEIHIWITSRDFENANLMILLAYIILGHKDWKQGEIKIFALYPSETIEEERNRLSMLIQAGQLPISSSNVKVLTQEPDVDPRTIISEHSRDADLTILGFREEAVRRMGKEVFEGFDDIGNVLFVNTALEKNIK